MLGFQPVKTRTRMRKTVVFAVTLLLVACSCNQTITTKDENIRLAISQRSYSLSEGIELEITVIGEGIYFHGPCDRWFERETDQGWEVIGECPDTNFTDEPFPQRPGNKLPISLPTSDTDNTYTYNYVLTPGVYRYGITYWTYAGPSTCYSPQFELVDD
jgi:hypothetical protein